MNEIIKSRRTIRVFKQEAVSDELLRKLLEAARVTSCAANNQRLRYAVVRTQPLVNQVLAETLWGGRVTPRRTPVAGESGPAAFIVVLAPATASDAHIYADAGAAIQSMQLQAWEEGLGCCWVGSVKGEKVAELLEISQEMKVLYVLAVGYPAETPVSKDVTSPKDVPYYLTDDNQLVVPKLTSDAIATWK